MATEGLKLPYYSHGRFVKFKMNISLVYKFNFKTIINSPLQPPVASCIFELPILPFPRPVLDKRNNNLYLIKHGFGYLSKQIWCICDIICMPDTSTNFRWNGEGIKTAILKVRLKLYNWNMQLKVS